MGTNDLEHPTFQKISGDTPQKAPNEGGRERSLPAKPELLERNAFSRYPTPTSHPSRSGLSVSDPGFPWSRRAPIRRAARFLISALERGQFPG